MELNRKPAFQEERLIESLLQKSFLEIPQDWKEGLMVCPMNDAMMGRSARQEYYRQEVWKTDQ